VGRKCRREEAWKYFEMGAWQVLPLHRGGNASAPRRRAVSNYDGTTMNCGLGYLNDHFKDYFVGG
jgi:hypothetical protein